MNMYAQQLKSVAMLLFCTHVMDLIMLTDVANIQQDINIGTVSEYCKPKLTLLSIVM